MAYGTKYRAGFSSKNTAGYIYIDLDGYSGSVTDLKTQPGTILIKYNCTDWENPIIGLVASFTILNDQANFFDLLPLLTATERQYRIRIEQTSPSSISLFYGFLNCETNEVPYLKNRPIRLNASSYLSKLQYVYLSLVDVLEMRSFIDVINAALAATGSADPIRVNSKLYPSGSSLGSGQTLFNRCGAFTEIFWKDNVDRDSALEIITKILKTFDCFIYWYSGAWYIERYEDIWNDTQNYVVYTSGASYGYTDSGSTAQTTEAVVDVQDLNPVNQSQIINTIPGLKQIEIRLNAKYLSNLTINDLTGADDVYGVVPYPDIRQWQKWVESGISWGDLGLPWKNISNSIKRTGWVGSIDEHRGIYTRFKMTKNSAVSLSIKWKYATAKGSFGSWSGNWSDYTFKFYWYLRHSPGNYFIMYNAGSDTWERNSTTEGSAMQEIEKPGTEFDDGNVSIELEKTIPIGSIAGITDGDNEFVFCVGTEIVSRSGVGDTSGYNAWLGDVLLVASGALDNNNILATVSNLFLNKKTIELDLFDASNLNIKNGIFYGSGYTTKSTTWTSNGSLFDILSDRLIRNKFQLYNKTREKISVTVKTANKYKPLRRFEDSEQSGLKFLLTSQTIRPDQELIDIEILEYDNTETITFS